MLTDPQLSRFGPSIFVFSSTGLTMIYGDGAVCSGYIEPSLSNWMLATGRPQGIVWRFHLPWPGPGPSFLPDKTNEHPLKIINTH